MGRKRRRYFCIIQKIIMDEPLSPSELRNVIVKRVMAEFSPGDLSFRTACIIADIAILECYRNVDKMCTQTIKSKLEKLI